MKKLAVTGGLSSGKSTACQFFKELGAPVLSADEIVHHLLSTHTPLKEKILTLFGASVLESGEISRDKLASCVFLHAEKLQELEKILHPLVFEEIANFFRQEKQRGSPLCIVEIPLLYETGKEKEFDLVIAVDTDPSFAKERFCKKTLLNQEEFDKRMKRQWPAKEKKRAADEVLVNNGSFDDLQKQVKTLYKKLKESGPHESR